MPLLGEELIERRRKKKWRGREEINRLGRDPQTVRLPGALSTVLPALWDPEASLLKGPIHLVTPSILLVFTRLFSTQGPETQVHIACPWATVPMTLSQWSFEMIWVFHDILWAIKWRQLHVSPRPHDRHSVVDLILFTFQFLLGRNLYSYVWLSSSKYLADTQKLLERCTVLFSGCPSIMS